MPTKIETLERSLAWQEHVIRHARTPEQRARATAAAARLRLEIETLRAFLAVD